MTLQEGAATVLIVDDESGITAMLADRLSFAGYLTIAADSADRAIELVRERNPDVIITDLYMPQRDGAQFVVQLREEGFETPVIMMSAGVEGEVAALRAQAIGYLEKPFNMNDAIDVIERALESRPTR